MTEERLDGQLSKLRIDKARKHPRRRGRRWPKVLGMLAVAAVAAGAIYAKVNAPIQVVTARIEQETSVAGKGAPLVTASGYVVPRHKVEVSSKLIARVKKLHIQRGAQVKEGDPLITLEDEDYQARVRAAEAQVASLQARLEELRTGSRPQEIAAAQAAVNSANATLADARRELERAETLAKKGMVSRQELDRARTAAEVAQARLDAEKKNAELVKIGPRKETIAAAEAQWNAAQAELEFAKTELSYTVIRAPISGTILEKLAEQGELVTNMNFGGTRGAKSSVVSMADLSDLQVEADLNESELTKVKLGQKAEIRIDANPDTIYEGVVDEISPQADRQKGTVQVKVRFLKPDALVITELNARVTFLGEALPTATASDHPRLWLPAAAILRNENAPAVYTLANGKAVLTPITLGGESERGIEVLEGLTGTETLIVSPVDKLTDGIRAVAKP